MRRQGGFALAWCVALGLAALPAFAEPTEHRVIRPPRDEHHRKPPVMSSVCVTPGGKLLATVGDDHCVRIWDAATGTLLHCRSDHADWVRAAAFSPDGSILATGGNDRQVIFWNAATGTVQKVFVRHSRAISNLAFSPDGTHLAVLGFEDQLHLYRVSDGQRIAQLGCPCRDMHALAFSPDGAFLAAGGRNGRLRVWRLADQTVLHENEAHSLRIRDITFTPDGAWIVTAGEDRAIRVCESHTGREVFVLPTGACKVYCLAILPDGRLASGGSDNRITVWDLQRRESVGWFDGHTGTVAALAVDGETLVSVGYDTTLRIWTTRPTPAIAEQPGRLRLGSFPQAVPR